MRTLARSCTECDTAEEVKVALIGTGSVEFTRNVVTDLCSYLKGMGRPRPGPEEGEPRCFSAENGLDAAIP